MALGEYQTSTSVESMAGTRSIGWKWENPPSTAACAQAGSSSIPSMTASASSRGISTCSRRWVPSYTVMGPASAWGMAAGLAACSRARSGSSMEWAFFRGQGLSNR